MATPWHKNPCLDRPFFAHHCYSNSISLLLSSRENKIKEIHHFFYFFNFYMYSSPTCATQNLAKIGKLPGNSCENVNARHKEDNNGRKPIGNVHLSDLGDLRYRY